MIDLGYSAQQRLEAKEALRRMDTLDYERRHTPPPIPGADNEERLRHILDRGLAPGEVLDVLHAVAAELRLLRQRDKAQRDELGRRAGWIDALHYDLDIARSERDHYRHDLNRKGAR